MVEESTGTAGLGLRGGTHSSSVVPRVATGTVVCGDGGTCGVWGLSAVLGTGNSGVTRASEAGLTSPAGIAECWSVSAGFAAATKAGFVGVCPFLLWQDKIRVSQLPNLISYPSVGSSFALWRLSKLRCWFNRYELSFSSTNWRSFIYTLGYKLAGWVGS